MSSVVAATFNGAGRGAAVVEPDLQAALALDDDRGVVSVYVGASDVREAETRVYHALGGSGLTRAEQRHARRQAIDLRQLLSARPRPTGRAAFLGVDTGRIVDVPLPSRPAVHVAFDERAHVRPLMTVLQDSAPAGFADLADGRLELHTVRGPAVTPHDTFAGDAEAFAEQVARVAEDESWDVVVAVGDPEPLAAFGERFRSGSVALIELDARGAPGSDALHAGVAGEIAKFRAERLAAVVHTIAQNPTSTWGAEAVLAAARRGRAAHVVIADDLPASDAEVLIRAALGTGADLTFTHAGGLGPHAVVARPRW